MNNLLELLQNFTLSKNEASLYLAGLKTDHATAYELAKLALLKRPTAYVTALGLVEKGLMTVEKKHGKIYYSATPPSRLYEIWKGRLAVLETAIPDLNRLSAQGTASIVTQTYEGKLGIETVYQEIVGVRDTKGDIIRLVTNLAAARINFDHFVAPWLKTVKDKRNKIRELVNNGPGIEGFHLAAKKLGNPNYELRRTTDDVFGASDAYIYKDKMALISLKEGQWLATVVRSSEITKTFKALFDMAWIDAEKFA